jgi:hypothetical protein
MAKKKHGSKRWIMTYDGRIKKSNDRTWKDKFSDLKDWTPMYGKRAWRGINKDNFCPQCKHVSKPIREQQDAIKAQWKEIHAKYDAQHGVAHKIWDTYRREHYWAKHDLEKGILTTQFPIYPTVPEPPKYSKWVRKHGKDIPH